MYRTKNDNKPQFDKKIFNDFNDLDITTGATNDLKQANELAKKYITEYGFGDNLCYLDESDNDTPFIARDMNDKNQISDNRKYDIDTQTVYLVEFAYKKALEIIMSNSIVFERLVNIIKENKTVSGKVVYDIIDEEKTSS